MGFGTFFFERRLHFRRMSTVFSGQFTIMKQSKLSKTLSHYLRHLPIVTYDSDGFVSISRIMSFKANLQTPAELINAVCNNPKARFQISFPVYRMSGPNRRQYVLPDIGIRATQGQSLRDDIGPGYLMAAQERLSMDNEESLPYLCDHGADPTAWQSIADLAFMATELLFTLQ